MVISDDHLPVIRPSVLRVGIDVGGTFTDLSAYDEATGRRWSAKVLTARGDEAAGIAGCFDAAGLAMSDAGFLGHGTTTGLNALLERGGATTGLLTTDGFRDVLEIGRTDRERGYDLDWRQPVAYVPRSRRAEVDERILHDGSVERAVDEEQARTRIAELVAAGVRSLAVCFLHAYANPEHEQRVRDIAARVAPDLDVSISSDVSAEFREYERSSTVVIDAYIKPVMRRYLTRLLEVLEDERFTGRLLLMRGDGGLMGAEQALGRPVGTLSSGPAAGVIAAARVIRRAGIDDAVAFDVGGTSTDVSLITAHQPLIETSLSVEWGLPARVPVVDVRSVGSGGGSIGWIDTGGALKMGPRSAGSAPGPVCYGAGGVEPTLSDALLVAGVLGRRLAAGRVELRSGPARSAIAERLAGPLGLDVDRVALGMIQIASENMANAVRSVSTWKGIEPRSLTLVAYGGAGGLLAAPVARLLEIPLVLIPPAPGNACAMGTLLADLRDEAAVSHLTPVADLDVAVVERRLAALAERVVASLAAQGAEPAEIALERLLDLRYRGQIHELRVPAGAGTLTASALEAVVVAFEDTYERQFGIRIAEGTPECVNLRVTGTAPLSHGGSEPSPPAPATVPASTREVLEPGIGWSTAAVHDRASLGAGALVAGPAVVEEDGSTTWVPSGTTCEVDGHANLRLRPEPGTA